jgi:hypothetical protein
MRKAIHFDEFAAGARGRTATLNCGLPCATVTENCRSKPHTAPPGVGRGEHDNKRFRCIAIVERFWLGSRTGFAVQDHLYRGIGLLHGLIAAGAEINWRMAEIAESAPGILRAGVAEAGLQRRAPRNGGRRRLPLGWGHGLSGYGGAGPDGLDDVPPLRLRPCGELGGALSLFVGFAD